MSNGIVFQVETSRILQILAKEIYDSPMALIRENVQNAYDAVRMRFFRNGKLEDGGKVEIIMKDNLLVIADNGIGMTENTLRENFWKAGSSGKHTDIARSAGVVGTFGIGAMANFGVCTKLEVETKAENSDEVLISVALRDSLKIGEETITLERSPSSRDFGTTIKATLDPHNSISTEQVLQYIGSYTNVLPIPIFFNGKVISQNTFESVLPIKGRMFSEIGCKNYNNDLYACTFKVLTDTNGQVMVKVDNITMGGSCIDGSMMLLQSGGQLMGFRSYFGLAPIPALGYYQFGGIVNLSFLQPTAGREALSRDSIAQVTQLVGLAEKAASEMLSNTNASDKNNAFLSWINAHQRYDLAVNITVQLLPEKVDITLSNLKSYVGAKRVYYYVGTDSSVLTTFANEETFVIHLSQTTLRRNIQLQYILKNLKFESIPNSAQITRVYASRDLSYQDAAILIRTSAVLRDDYLIPDVEVIFADISHGVTILPEKKGDTLNIYISRNSSLVPPLIEFYDNARDLFSQLIKDFVRVNLYSKIQQFVPSSTRDGVETLRKALQRNRELYRYEEADLGELEGVLGDYLSGDKSLSEVLHQARSSVVSQTQRVSREQIGSIENVIPSLVQTAFAFKTINDKEQGQDFLAHPPILMDDVQSDMKILLANDKYPSLNGFKMFLGLSDRLMKMESEFFRAPHTTRILWGGHRIVYIFTEVTGRLSLYYDIELRNAFDNAKTGGEIFPSTTLITKQRIFVPIPDALIDEFSLKSEAKEFFVRFDVLPTDVK